jgi:thioredoxin-related protein
MLRRTLLFAAAALLSGVVSAAAVETPLPAAQDLRRHALSAQRQGQPLILLVSLPDCPYCEQVRKQQLAPLTRQGMEVRQIYINSTRSLNGFYGLLTSEKAVAGRYAVKATPTVLFLGAQGQQLAPPILGALLEDFYGAYLEQALEQASQQLASPELPH